MYKCCSLLEKKKKKVLKEVLCRFNSLGIGVYFVSLKKKKKKKKEGENECKSHIDMNEDLNMIYGDLYS